MATIVTRAGKGSPLTHAEVDANFNNLNSDKAETSALGTAAFTASTDYATAAQGSNADTAYGWGDHALGGYAAASHTHTLSDITDAGTAAAADTTDFDPAGSAVALAIALG